MNKQKLKACMAEYGDTQKDLAGKIGLSLSRFNAKLNSKRGAEFTQTEMLLIAKCYKLSPQWISEIFFEEKVS